MRIAIDVSIQGRPWPTGVERAQATLVDALLDADVDHDFVLLTPGRVPDAWRGRRVRVVEGGGDARRTALWRETVVPPELARQRVDLFHSPVAAVPWRAPCDVLATIHELSSLRHDGWRHWRHAARVRHAAQAAWRLLCVSERTRSELVARHPRAADRARVVRNAVDPRFGPRDAEGPSRAAVLERCGLPDGDYLLAVGRLRRKKNLDRVLSALASPGLRDRRLLIAGPPGDAAASLTQRAAQADLAGRVHLLGFVPDELLVPLVQHARCLVHAAAHEGFGLPVAEALACGTPVVSSLQGAVDEASRGDALVSTFDLGEPAALAESLLSAWEQAPVRRPGERDGARALRDLLDVYAEWGQSSPRTDVRGRESPS